MEEITDTETTDNAKAMLVVAAAAAAVTATVIIVVRKVKARRWLDKNFPKVEETV